jgi:hypothetical protein
MLNAIHCSGQGLQFTSDSKSVAYSIRENGVDNVWVQPLDGSAGHALMHFTTARASLSCAATGIPTLFCCKNPSSEAADPDMQ